MALSMTWRSSRAARRAAGRPELRPGDGWTTRPWCGPWRRRPHSPPPRPRDAGGPPPAPGEATPGAKLHAALAELLEGAAIGLRLAPVACLANCERGCSAAISAAGKWTYLLGGLGPAHAADLLTYAASYAASANGTVLPSRRPASLRQAVLARVPAPELLA